MEPQRAGQEVNIDKACLAVRCRVWRGRGQLALVVGLGRHGLHSVHRSVYRQNSRSTSTERVAGLRHSGDVGDVLATNVSFLIWRTHATDPKPNFESSPGQWPVTERSSLSSQPLTGNTSTKAAVSRENQMLEIGKELDFGMPCSRRRSVKSRMKSSSRCSPISLPCDFCKRSKNEFI